MVGYIICGISIVISSVIIIQKKVKIRSRQKEYSDWQVNDQIYLKSNDNSLTLLGWEKSAIYIEKDGSTHKIDWAKFDFNKSAIWRRNHQACEKEMGKSPGFAPGLGEKLSNKETVDGKPIELLSEIECQVYLKQAIETENYELAEKIKKQMEKYR
jgi:hypothetical protein